MKRMEVKRIITGISPNYVKNWDVIKGIREIIQNYLDTKNEFRCKGYIHHKDGLAMVKDFGPGLEPKHLALGVSEKGSDAIGKYGEGLKLALLVLARERRNVEIWSNGTIIRPDIEHSDLYGTEVMVFNIQPMQPCHAKTHQGTTIRFQCSKDELEAAKSYFKCFLSEKSGFKWIEKDRISLPGGYIYINGARVGKISDALFSYHLYEKETGDIGNRDREVIDQEKVEPYIRKILAETSSLTVMRKVLKALINREYSWEIKIGLPSWMISKKSRSLWKRAFYEIVGTKDAVLSSWRIDDNTRAGYLGYKVVDISGHGWWDLLNYVGIKTAAEIAAEDGKKSSKRIAIKNLTDEERNNLKIAKRLVGKYYNPVGEVIIMEDLTGMVNAARGLTINGACELKTGKIYLRREILSNLHQTLHTLLHEAVHKYTGADDCTAAFERALTEVSVNIILGLEELE